MSILDTPENLEVFDYIFDAGYYLQYKYPKIATPTDEDRVKKLAYIVQNEFFYIDFRSKRKGIRYTEGLSELTLEEAETIIAEFKIVLHTRKNEADCILEGHNSRVKGQKTDRYTRWKKAIFEMYADHQYCFCCGSTESLEPDHVKGHNSFKNLKRAYSLKNGQLLCSLCNQAKGSLEGQEWDFRSDAHVLAIFRFIRNYGTDFIEK